MKPKAKAPFKSNRCIAIHVSDLKQAATFHGEALGFRLLSRSPAYLEYDAGTLLLYVNRSKKALSPIPSLSVANIKAAKRRLIRAGCRIVDDRGGSLYFRDPFGFTFDVVEE